LSEIRLPLEVAFLPSPFFMSSFKNLNSAENKKRTVKDVLHETRKLNAPKKYKKVFSFFGTVGELKNKLKI